jgi:hypothetical protein
MGEDFSFASIIAELKKLGDISEYGRIFVNLTTESTNLNKSLGENRQRISELTKSIADAIPDVVRLGGDITKTTETISEIALASNRSFLANVETVKEIYAASEILNTDAERLVESFNEIGILTNNIGENIEQSINYVQSIGANANEVMKDVLYNTDELNRYNFENGVIGLTKMAAKASLLRYDMNQVFNFADSLINPERAVEVASAFQRLGVSAGNLVDPFQLMNQSINDPSGLLDSLSDVAKSFAEFDSETKSFKISRQGVLTLKELGSQIGIDSKELSKMALAAAELDSRLSQISPTIKFQNEEDKQYLANIASMNERGEYVIKVNDKDFKLLSEVTQEEMNKLVEEQKKQPKTLEDIQRNSFDLTKIISKDVEAIRYKIAGGITTAPTALEFAEKTRRGASIVTGGLSEMGSVSGMRNLSEQNLENLTSLISDFFDENKTTEESLSSFVSKSTDLLKTIGADSKEGVSETLNKINENLLKNDIDVSKLNNIFGSFDGFKDFYNERLSTSAELNSLPNNNDFTKYTSEFETILKDINKGNAKPEELTKFLNDNRSELSKYGIEFSGIMSKNADQFKEYFQSNNRSQEKFNDYLSSYNNDIKSFSKGVLTVGKSVDQYGTMNKNINDPLNNNSDAALIKLIEGKNKVEPIKSPTQNQNINVNELNTTTVIHKIQFDKLPVEIQLPSNFAQLSVEQQQQILDKVFNSPKFQNYITNTVISQNQNPTKVPINTTYSPK